ncbi:MAG: polysaccharide deacetylase family protein [Acidobacteriota bacterium]
MAPNPPSPNPPRPWRPAPLITASAALHLAAAVAWPRLGRGGRRRLAAGLGVSHVALSLAGTLPRGRWLGPNVRRLDEIGPAPDAVALTFDDGPDPEITPRVLDHLDAAGARASFFVIGRRAAAHPDLVREIARRGHRVENHTDEHPHTFAFYGPRAQAREIDRAQITIGELTGRRPIWFRAPAGIRNPLLEPLLAARGLHLVSWTRRAFDTVERQPRKVVARLVDGLDAGDVLLLHDGAAAGRPPVDRHGAPVVLEALPRLLDLLAARRLRAVSLPSAAGV